MSLQGAEIKDGKLVLTIANKKGNSKEVTINIDTITGDSYTKSEADSKFASKEGAPEDMDEMIEVSDAIKDIKDVNPYEETEIDSWFSKE